MKTAYMDADLVICRSGALTVSELMSVGVASILVPFPYAVDDHQTANAGYLEQVDGGVICQQSDTNSKQLGSLMIELIEKQRLSVMATNAWKSRKTEAAELVLAHCQELINV